MIDLILGILATLICGFGYATLYFFTVLFWLVIITLILEHYNVGLVVKLENKDVKDFKEEKT